MCTMSKRNAAKSDLCPKNSWSRWIMKGLMPKALGLSMYVPLESMAQSMLIHSWTDTMCAKEKHTTLPNWCLVRSNILDGLADPLQLPKARLVYKNNLILCLLTSHIQSSNIALETDPDCWRYTSYSSCNCNYSKHPVNGAIYRRGLSYRKASLVQDLQAYTSCSLCMTLPSWRDSFFAESGDIVSHYPVSTVQSHQSKMLWQCTLTIESSLLPSIESFTVHSLRSIVKVIA